MKKNVKKIKIKENLKEVYLSIVLSSLALFLLRLLSGFNNIDGYLLINYSLSYIFILAGEFLFITSIFILLTYKSKLSKEQLTFLLPPILFAALGMMRIDSSVPIISIHADYSPAVMTAIFLAFLVLTCISGHSVLYAVSTVAGTALFPAYGLCFSPFNLAAAYLFSTGSKKEKKISLIINAVCSLSSCIYSVIKLGVTAPSFNKNYIPVIFLIICLGVFFIVKKEYSLLPLCVLPLFPLFAGIFLGVFPTPMFVLSASVSPFVLTMGTAVTLGENEKLKGYAEKLLHNPTVYIIVLVFILHTACAIFALPGVVKNTYI